MREVIDNAYQFIRTAAGQEADVAGVIKRDVFDAEEEQNISANRVFGRLALRLYQQEGLSGDYELMLLELKHDMTERKLKIDDLGLPDDEAEKLRALTGLE